MLLPIVLILTIVTTGVVLIDAAAEKSTEKRLLLHSGDDIASELMTLKAEMSTLTQELNSLKNASELTAFKAEQATTTKHLEDVLAEVKSLKASQQNASELTALKAEQAITTKHLETVLAEVNSLKMSQQNAHGAVYTRWGRNSCPKEAELVYHGYIGGKYYNGHGSGSDHFCLPFDPTWGNYTDGFENDKAKIYGTELDMIEPNHIFPYPVNDNDMPCAVCKSIRRTSIIVPARTDCYPGWTLEYTGYLATALERADFQGYDIVCLDSLTDFVPHGGTSDNQHILYLAEAHCGSLPCPPYVNGRELACAVCTILCPLIR